MKLIHKLFLALFVTNVVIVVLVFVLIATSFSAKVNDFVSNREAQHVAKIKQELIRWYQTNQNWETIEINSEIWTGMVDAKSGDYASTYQENEKQLPPKKPANIIDQKQIKPKRNFENPEAFVKQKKVEDENKYERQKNPKIKSIKGYQSDDFLETGKRLSIYDAKKQVILGKENIDDNPYIEAIYLNEGFENKDNNKQLIGWLGLIPSKSAKDSPANEFLAQQYKTYYYIGAGVIVLSLIVAWLLSKHFMRPIKNIIHATEQLIKGDYQQRINKLANRDELAGLSENLNQLAYTLDKNQQNRFKWMSDTSHELRTPLTVLRSHLIAVQDGIFMADEKRVALLLDEIDGLSNIIDDIYQLSSCDAGALTYKKQSLNPIGVLLKVIETYQIKFSQKQINVDIESLKKIFQKTQISMLADKDRLKQLFSNLLENSYRYTDQSGQINITANLNNKKLEIHIQDSFPSVANANLQKLFERFYRVDQSRNRNNGGSGLGLALCQQIVLAHKGTIEINSSKLGGLHVTISFNCL